MSKFGEKFASDLTWQEEQEAMSVVASRRDQKWEYEHETKGDHYNTNCPWCGKNNTYVTDGIAVTPKVVRVFEKLCQHCKKPIIFQAEMTIITIAARKGDKGILNDLFERLNKA